MGDNKTIAKNSIILYLRLIITSVIGLFSSRIVIHSLGVSDYGLYTVVGGIVVMMAFINTIMMAATYRFIAYEMGKSSDEGVNKVFNISFLIHLFLAIIVIMLTETFGMLYVNNYLNVETTKLSDAAFVLRFSTYATVLQIVSMPFQGLITAQEKFGVRASVEVIRSILALLVAFIILHYLGNKLRMYSVLIMLANLIPAILFISYCKLKYAQFIKWKLQNDVSKYKEMIVFTGWNMLGAAAQVGQSTGSPLIINTFFGTTLNAAYGIGNQIKAIVSQFAANLAQAAMPQITKSYSGGNTERSVNIVAYTSKYTWFLMLLPSLPILLETEYLLNLWLVEVPPFAIIFCQLMIILTLVNGLGNGLMALVQATGKIKYFQIVLSTTSLIGLPIAFFLYKIGKPPPTIIYVFIITSLINRVVIQILLNKLIDFDVIAFIKTSYVRILFVVTLISPLFIIINYFTDGFIRFIAFSCISIIWLTASIYFAGFENKERKTILTTLLKVKSKIQASGKIKS